MMLTRTFGILYVFFVLSLDRRRVLHFNVTRHPSAEWTARQVVEACPFEVTGRFLIRDNDKIYGRSFAIGLMGSDSYRNALPFNLLGRKALPKDGLPAYEEIAWTM